MNLSQERYKLYYYNVLHEIGDITLKTPLTVHIDPSNKCNFLCKYCPTGHPDLLNRVCRPCGFMKFSLFKKTIDDLKLFSEPIQRLHLYNDGEPLLNPDFFRMVKYAKDSDVAQSVETTTNAHLLSEDMSEELIKAGLNRIRISVKHVTTEGYFRTVGKNVEIENIIKNVRSLYNKAKELTCRLFINITIVDTGLSEEEKARFFSLFEDLSDGIRIDTMEGWSRNDLFDFSFGTSHLSGTSPSTTAKQGTVCPLPFNSFSVKFDGTVSACFVDWSHCNIIGDVRSENLIDIWNGERLHTFRISQLENRKYASVACATCDYVNGLQRMINLDAAREHLKDINNYNQTNIGGSI